MATFGRSPGTRNCCRRKKAHELVNRSQYHDEREFDGLDSEEIDLEGVAFDSCAFRGCDLSGASLRGSHLTECRFERCELSALLLTDALLHSVEFDGCRLTGVDFGVIRRDAVGLTVNFERCDLTLASFHGLDLRGCSFSSIVGRELSFVDCDLRGVQLSGSDLSAARFQGNDLRDVDLRGSRDYLISPLDNRVAGMRVELPEALGLLLGLDIRLHD